MKNKEYENAIIEKAEEKIKQQDYNGLSNEEVNFIYEQYNVEMPKIPIILCKYFIGQMIMHTDSLKQLRGIVFESLSLHYINKLQTSIWNVKSLTFSEIRKLSQGNRNSAGCTRDREMLVLSKEDEEFFRRTNITALFSAIHEPKHAKQFLNIDKNIMEDGTYIMMKEEIIEEHITDFYDNYYSTLLIEEDANLYAAKETKKIIDELGLSNLLIGTYIYDQKVIELLNNNEEKSFLKRKLINEQTDEEIASSKLFENIFKNLSFEKRKFYFKKHPDLLLEFNENGTKKYIYEIIRDLEKEMTTNNRNEKVLNELFECMILNDSVINFEDIPNEITKLLNLPLKTDSGKKWRIRAIQEKLIIELVEGNNRSLATKKIK